MENMNDYLAGLADQQIPGGCGSCDAYQKVVQDENYPGIFQITVHHDDDCPDYQCMQQNRAQRRAAARRAKSSQN